MHASVGALGVLFTEWVLSTEWFSVMAAFVAINTVIYTALAIAKMLPKIYLSDWQRRRYERSETRSIHPDASR